METRIERLEDFAGETRERLARVESKLDHIGHEIGQFKWWIVAAILTILVTVIGTGVGIQQMTVATFQAAAQQPPQQQAPIIIQVPAQAAPTAPKP